MYFFIINGILNKFLLNLFSDSFMICKKEDSNPEELSIIYPIIKPIEPVGNNIN